MSKYIINGGRTLKGEVRIAGAKNHAIKMIPAALLSAEPCLLTNVPNISDITTMSAIVKQLGGEVEYESGSLKIDSKNLKPSMLPTEMVAKMRASFLFIIPLLHRFGEVIFPHPGGDAIGRRPIDMTLDFLTAMGVRIIEAPDAYKIMAPEGLRAVNYTFKWITHTGTEAIVMAAVVAKGTSVVKNCATEPEVEALCRYLSSVGAKIEGIGTSTLTITGVKKLSGGKAQIIPDRIEAGTFAIMGALCGEIKICNIRPDHLDSLWKYFALMGISYELGTDWVTVKKTKNMKPEHVKTHEYPGFPTDLQPPMTLLLTQAHGLSMMHETVYDGRLFYTDKLNKMGANIIMSDPHRVIIQGPSKLYGVKIGSPDVRAGIALIMGALIASGTSEIDNVHHVQRGYENIVERLKSLGADISEEE